MCNIIIINNDAMLLKISTVTQIISHKIKDNLDTRSTNGSPAVL